MEISVCSIEEGEGPLVAAAIHNGHALRDDVLDLMALGEADRLREEDPFTAEWTSVGDTAIVGLRSRFEVDLNRPADGAVYLKPADAWGLELWHDEPPPRVIDASLAEYDRFYEQVHELLSRKADTHGGFLLYDLHSYNHRRNGPDHPPEDPELNPEINVGTGTMDRERWAPVVDAFIEALRGAEFMGRRLDVRENVKFKGGHFPQWIHQQFPETGCALAIEVKKIFMDEWTGEPDWEAIEAVRAALEHTVAPTLDSFRRVLTESSHSA